MRTGREEHPRPVTSGRCRELPRVSPIPTRGRHRGARHRRTDHDDATKCLLYAELREGGESVAAIMTALRAVLEHYGVPMALYTDRAHWAVHTPTSGSAPAPIVGARETERFCSGSPNVRSSVPSALQRAMVKRGCPSATQRLVDQLDLQEQKPSGADPGWSYRRDYVQRRTVVREPRRTVR